MNEPREYSDAERMHWYACRPEGRRGTLAEGTAEVMKIGDDGTRWVRLGRPARSHLADGT